MHERGGVKAVPGVRGQVIRLRNAEDSVGSGRISRERDLKAIGSVGGDERGDRPGDGGGEVRVGAESVFGDVLGAVEIRVRGGVFQRICSGGAELFNLP
jgi:hypothetical protein